MIYVIAAKNVFKIPNNFIDNYMFKIHYMIIRMFISKNYISKYDWYKKILVTGGSGYNKTLVSA